MASTLAARPSQLLLLPGQCTQNEGKVWPAVPPDP